MARIVLANANQITAPQPGLTNFGTMGQAAMIPQQQATNQQASGDASSAQAIASNPANGINNLELQGGQGGTGLEGSAQGVPPDELVKALNAVANASSDNASQYAKPIEDLFTRTQDPDIKHKLQKIVHALAMTNDPKRQTIDPATGKQDPTAGELAQKLSEEITKMTNAKEKIAPSQQERQRQESVTSAVKPFNWREAQARKKKKSRGNPFRVLMGKAGKLLESGVSKSDIIRYLKKTMDYFDVETISRCVDVVRDYNKKRFHPNQSSTPDSDSDSDSDSGSSSKKAQVQKQALPQPTNNHSTLASDRFPVAHTFNWNRYAAIKNENKAETIFDAVPCWEKRSTGELLSRLHSLTCSSKEAMKNEFPAPVMIPNSGDSKAIRAALKARGFGDSEIDAQVGTQTSRQGQFND